MVNIILQFLQYSLYKNAALVSIRDDLQNNKKSYRP